jgi:predicted dehydrogenase
VPDHKDAPRALAGADYVLDVLQGGGDAVMVALPFPDQGREPLRIELEEFLGAARFGWTVPASGQDALQALRLALKASRQIAAAEPVPWPA